MAAGLQSFQSNDKQMQAIRELTNELFNLKQRQTQTEASISTINTEVETLKAKSLQLKRISIPLAAAVEIAAGSVGTIGINLTTYSPKCVGYIYQSSYLPDGNTLSGLLVSAANFTTDPPSLSLKLYNQTEEAVSVKYVVITAIELSE